MNATGKFALKGAAVTERFGISFAGEDGVRRAVLEILELCIGHTARERCGMWVIMGVAPRDVRSVMQNEEASPGQSGVGPSGRIVPAHRG